MPVATASTRIIEVDGSRMDDPIASRIESALVVDRLAMPDMFELVFRDQGRTIITDAGLDIGKGVVISTASRESPSPAKLIDGEVTVIGTDYDALGKRTVVRGYDRSHRLAAGRKTASYVGMPYSDIVKQLASAASLTPDVDDTGTVLDHVLQANQSDLDFLYSLARLVDFDLRVDGTKLLFKKLETGGSSGVELAWGEELLEFRARASAVGQVTKVQVRGWDIEKKEAIVGEAETSSAEPIGGSSPNALAGKVGGQTLVVVDHPAATDSEASDLATARAAQVSSAAYEGTAVAHGSPDLKAGATVKIKGVEPKLEGDWVVTSTRHEFGAGTYRTALEFSGRQDRSLTGVLNNASPTAGTPRIPGVVIGIVSENEDPLEIGRVKVKLPWLSDDAVSWWARVVMPGAGPAYGMYWIPQVGDEVLVAFEHGDVSRPMVLGGLWNGSDASPFDYGDRDSGDSSIKRCGFRSRKGNDISFFDADDKLGIQLSTKDEKVVIHLDETNGELAIKVKGKVKIEADGDVSIESKGNFKVKADQGLSLESSGQVQIKGSQIALG